MQVPFSSFLSDISEKKRSDMNKFNYSLSPYTTSLQDLFDRQPFHTRSPRPVCAPMHTHTTKCHF